MASTASEILGVAVASLAVSGCVTSTPASLGNVDPFQLGGVMIVPDVSVLLEDAPQPAAAGKLREGIVLGVRRELAVRGYHVVDPPAQRALDEAGQGIRAGFIERVDPRLAERVRVSASAARVGSEEVPVRVGGYLMVRAIARAYPDDSSAADLLEAVVFVAGLFSGGDDYEPGRHEEPEEKNDHFLCVSVALVRSPSGVDLWAAESCGPIDLGGANLRGVLTAAFPIDRS